MSDERDELQKIIFQSMRLNTQIDLTRDRRLQGSQLAWAGYAADSVLNAGYQTQASLAREGYRKPRTITTAEELDALRTGSVVLDVDGDPWKKRGDGLWLGFRNEMEESRTLCWGHMETRPTVLHEPEAQP